MRRRWWAGLLMLATMALSLGLGTVPVSAATQAHLTGEAEAPTISFTAPAACQTHTVQHGETLSGIAQHWGTTWPLVYAANRRSIGADPNRLQPGMILRYCPAAASPNGPTTAGQPCRSTTYWPTGAFTTATTPPGCYASAYPIDPARYPRVSATFGGCDWWPAALHPTWNIWAKPKHDTPRVGAAILYRPGEQGAGSEGHWGVIVALSADGRFALSSEMNFTIVGRHPHSRDGGWGMVVYRYVRVQPPATQFVY